MTKTHDCSFFETVVKKINHWFRLWVNITHLNDGFADLLQNVLLEPLYFILLQTIYI